MQYFLGYSSFSDVAPFDPSLFVEFRKRLGLEQINAINESILQVKLKIEKQNKTKQIQKLIKTKNHPPMKVQ